MQLSFLDGGRRVLLEGATGRLEYIPDFVEAAQAREWFLTLRDGVTWRSERRMMYDREVDVPRLVSGFKLAADDVPPPIAEAARRISAETGTVFDSAGLNFYRDGRDSVAPHNDHTEDLAPGKPIALLSLGATRHMTIRAKTLPRRKFDVDLEPGSLLLMSYETQNYYDHGIPKTNEPVGERISVAFRVRR